MALPETITENPPAKTRHRRRPQQKTVPVWRRADFWFRAMRVFLFVAAGIAVWHLAVEGGFISALILASPTSTAEQLGSLTANIFSGGFMAEHVVITLQEILIGFVLAVVLGVASGVLISETTFGRDVLMPFFVGINAVPKITLVPVFAVWLGFGTAPKIAMAATIAYFPVVIDTIAGLQSADRQQLMLFRSLQANRLTTLIKLKFPAAMPSIFAGMKTATSLAVAGAIVGEFLGGGDGLGAVIRTNSANLNMPTVYATIVLLSIMGLLLFWAIAVLERTLVFWRSEKGGFVPTAV